MKEKKIIELFNKYKDLRTKKPIEESMTLYSFKRAIKEVKQGIEKTLLTI